MDEHDDGSGLTWGKPRGHWERVCDYTGKPDCHHQQTWHLHLMDPYPQPDHGDHWGKWYYDAENQVIAYRERPNWETYYVELDRARGYLDQAKWLKHLSEKRWVRGSTLQDLADAMADLDDVPLKRKQRAM